MTPEISIIVPVYGVEQYLDRCVKSLLAQTYKDIEIILVDDGSPDRCPQMCDGYLELNDNPNLNLNDNLRSAGTDACLSKNPNLNPNLNPNVNLNDNSGNKPVIRVVHKENGGLSSARLAGFREARGKYCIFIDSDDYIDDNMIEVLHRKAVETDADLTMCSWYTDVAGDITPHYWKTGWEVIERDEIMQKYFLPLVGNAPGSDYSLTGFFGVRLIKREFIEESMFVSERDYIVEDVLFHLMLCTKLNRIAMVDEPHYCYYFNGESLTNKYREGAWEKMYAFYHFILRLCEENNVREQAAAGLQFKLLTAVAFSVLNACKKVDYTDAKKDLRVILLHPEVSEMFKTIDRSHFTIQQKVIYLAWKTGMYYPMYKYLRWRMKI